MEVVCCGGVCGTHPDLPSELRDLFHQWGCHWLKATSCQFLRGTSLAEESCFTQGNTSSWRSLYQITDLCGSARPTPTLDNSENHPRLRTLHWVGWLFCQDCIAFLIPLHPIPILSLLIHRALRTFPNKHPPLWSASPICDVWLDQILLVRTLLSVFLMFLWF